MTLTMLGVGRFKARPLYLPCAVGTASCLRWPELGIIPENDTWDMFVSATP